MRMLVARRKILTALAIAFFLLNICYFWSRRPAKPTALPLNRLSRLWRDLHPLLEEHAPQCPPPVLNGGPGVKRFDAVKETPRRNYITNVDEIQQPMREMHDGVVRAIHNSHLDPPYIPGTTGIVSSAGGTYLPTFLVTVLLLRRTGSTLPVELFMRDRNEYEPSICQDILPPLGVRCIILSDIFTNPENNDNPESTLPPIEGFQLKAFAILFSSFENLLWLDADCIPLHDPATILTSAPFTTTGMLTWPDFWANTAAPAYFHISNQPAPPLTTRQATEAGILAISKPSHALTLLLAAYYNYYGPDYYYPLLDQGAPGAGDKDTFLHAATALNQTFYAVSEPVVDLGNLTPNPDVAINAGYIQADPVEDFALTSRGIWRVKGSSSSSSSSRAEGSSDPDPPAPRAFFIHAGDPEFNPGNKLLGSKLQGSDGRPTRLWTYPPEALSRVGYDAEKAIWEEIAYIVCDLQPAFKTWEGKVDLCGAVRKHWSAVFADPKGIIEALGEVAGS
ncbi:mannosyltransferase putative-domain-containing protein [Aspergillus heterothallicus]